jgi:hypothetical protein
MAQRSLIKGVLEVEGTTRDLTAQLSLALRPSLGALARLLGDQLSSPSPILNLYLCPSKSTTRPSKTPRSQPQEHESPNQLAKPLSRLSWQNTIASHHAQK